MHLVMIFFASLDLKVIKNLDLKVIGKSDFNGEFTLTYIFVLLIIQLQ